jgi:hypothetical protein
MQDLPHHYRVNASAEHEGNIILKADDLPRGSKGLKAGVEHSGGIRQWHP